MYFEQHKAYKNYFSKGHIHLIFPVVTENRTLSISNITTNENKNIPKFLMWGIQRAKLSLETNIIVIHERSLKLILGNTLKELSNFLYYFNGCFIDQTSLC